MLDEVYEMNLDFNSEVEIKAYFDDPKFIKELAIKYKKEIPAMFVCTLNKDMRFIKFEPTKQGILMDWRFFAEIDKITKEDINFEKNIEKRRLLIMEYGVNNYFEEVQVLNKSIYGKLISTNFLGSKQQFVQVRNGTIEPEENREYLKEKQMLTKDNHKIYYIPVSDFVTTAKEGIEESWGLSKGVLPESGWDFES